MRPVVAFFLLCGYTFAAGNLSDGPDADLIYDPMTGNVVLDGGDTPTGRIIGFTFWSPEGRMNPVADELIPWFLPGGVVSPDNHSQVITFNDLDMVGLPSIFLGPILPTGLGLLDLEQLFTKVAYAYAPGATAEMDLIVLPEPASSQLVAFGLMGLVGTVRRRRRVASRCASRPALPE